MQSKATAGFTYIMAAEQVVAVYNITFDKCDRAKVKLSICNRIKAREQYREVVSILVDNVTRDKSRPQNIGQTIINNRAGKHLRS